MELRTVLKIIRRNWIVIAVTILVALGVGVLLIVVLPPSYQTETKVLLTPSVRTGAAAELVPANTLLVASAPTYTALATTPVVLDPAIKASGADVASTDLVDDVTATLEPETSIITITVNADSAEGVAKLTNAISASLISRVEAVSGVVGDVGITGTVVEAPEIPTSPASPNVLLTLAVALAAGLALAFMIVAFRQALHTPARRTA